VTDYAAPVLVNLPRSDFLNRIVVQRLFPVDDLHIGQRFVSGMHLIDEEQIKAFATQFDPQAFHLDAEAAKDMLFKGLVASMTIRESARVFTHFSMIWGKPGDRLGSFQFERVANKAKTVDFLAENANSSDQTL
jgi:MaoC like domain